MPGIFRTLDVFIGTAAFAPGETGAKRTDFKRQSAFRRETPFSGFAVIFNKLDDGNFPVPAQCPQTGAERAGCFAFALTGNVD